MTDIPPIPTPPVHALDQPRTLLFLAYPQMGLLDLTGAQTVFWAATKARAARGLPGYRLVTASLEGGLVPTAEGLAVGTEPLAPWLREPLDTLVVPGAPEIVRTLPDHAELVAWLAQAAQRARRTASVCSGTFLLAAAGLLDGRRAATHWAMCDALHRRFPAIEVDAESIFVQQDQVWTSAGVSAGIDLALALVEADCGREVAMQVARELVVFLKRPGGQAQFSELLKAQGEDSAAFEALHLWLNEHLGDPRLTVERLAEQACDEVGNFAVMSCQHAIPLGRYAGNNAAAELIGVAPMIYSQPKYVTCLDLGAWGAVYTEGWERTVSPPTDTAEAKQLKQQINSVWIYPPAADRATALAAADPLIPVA